MDVIGAIRTRRSIRRYKDESLPEGAIDTLLEAARMANSARNRQEWAFVVVSDRGTKQKLVPACNNQSFVGDASVVIVGCATSELTMRCGQPAHAIDTAIALDHIQLTAVELGLGTCWLGSFFPEQVARILDIPEDVTIIGILTIGIPDENGREKSRKDIREIVHKEKWGLR